MGCGASSAASSPASTPSLATKKSPKMTKVASEGSASKTKPFANRNLEAVGKQPASSTAEGANGQPPGSVRKFKIGDRVKGNYGNGAWYRAAVEDIQGDKYVLAWDDGDTQNKVRSEDQLMVCQEDTSEDEESDDACDEEAQRKYRVGDRVKGKYKNGKWYSAVVVGYDGDQYVLAWDDGDKADTLKTEDDLEAIGGEGEASSAQFKVGDHVKGQYKNGSWYSAVIVGRAGDKFVLAWDDGDPADTIKTSAELRLRRENAVRYKVGDKVLAKYHTGSWYKAVIAEVDEEVYVVAWDDGDQQDIIKVGVELKPRRSDESGLDPAVDPQMLLQLLADESVGAAVREMGGSVTAEQLGKVLGGNGTKVDAGALEALFDSLDSDGNGRVSLGEVQRALRMQSGAVDPTVQVHNFMQDAGVMSKLVEVLVSKLRESGVGSEDVMQHVIDKYDHAAFEALFDRSKAELASCLEAERAKVAESTKAAQAATAANSKFASGQDVFEGAYGGMDDFLDGLDAIGLPQPKTYEGMVADFTLAADSHEQFVTSNYGGIPTTPAQEWEFVTDPRMDKVYPGGRVPVKLETYLRAVAAQGYQEELDKMDAKEQSAVCVVLLRRIRAQLAPRGFKKATGKPADHAMVRDVCQRLDECLAMPCDPDSRAPSREASKKTSKAKHKSGGKDGKSAATVEHGASPSWRQIAAAMKALVSEEDLMKLVVHERARLRRARLTREEVVGLRLYTGPAFIKMNAVLRKSSGKLPERMWQHLRGNSYVSTIHACVSGMVKLSKVSQIPPERKVYRGMAGLRLPKCFWQADELGARGGVEFGFMSTTTKREIAMQYLSSGKALATIFEIQVGMIDRGSSISFLSQFPGEDEVLIPPRSNLEVVGDPFVEHTKSGPVIVIPARINCNIKSKTMEQIRQQRKALHLSLVENLIKEVQRELDAIEGSDAFNARGKADYVRGGGAPLLASVREECDDVVERHRRKKAAWFNEDSNYKRILEEAISLKSMALGKIKYWMDNKEECATGVGGVDQKPMMMVQRLQHGKLLAALEQAKASGDATKTRELALSLCKEENLIAAVKHDAKSKEYRGNQGVFNDDDDDDDDNNDVGHRWWVESDEEDEAGAGLLERTDDNGETPLTSCCASGRVRQVRLLVDAGADVDAVDDSDNSALMVAAMGGHTEVIDFVIASGAFVDARNGEGKSPLIKCAELGHLASCKALLAGGADIDFGDRNGWNAVMWATQYNRVDAVRLLLEHKADVNAKASGGWTALFDAATPGLVECGRVLLDGGIDPNAQRSSKSTAMHVAAQNGHTAFVELLLRYNGDPDIRGIGGNTPLAKAAQRENAETVKVLLAAKANPNISNDSDMTPVQIATDDGVRKLLEKAMAK